MGINTYAYVGGDPVGSVDTLGLAPTSIDTSLPLDLKPSFETQNLPDLAAYRAATDSKSVNNFHDNIITDFAHTGLNSCDEDAKFFLQTGLSLLSNNSGNPSILYGDTIQQILDKYNGIGFSSIGSWVRYGQELQYLYPNLTQDELKAVAEAILRLPNSNQGMMIAIPWNATDADIANELKSTLGGLVTNKDILAFISALTERGSGPLLVDIKDLYQEILARYQTRLHSDERVWQAEISANQAQSALDAHIGLKGENVCSGRVNSGSQSCQDRRALQADVTQSTEQYLTTLANVNNEMAGSGLMPLMDEKMANQSQAREQFAAISVAAAGVFVPLTLQDAAVDLATAGFGRFTRVGGAIADIARTARGVGRAALNRIRHVSDTAVGRVRGLRKVEVWHLKPTTRGNAIEARLAQTEYNSWFNVGQLHRGYFPYVDFQQGKNLVSLKTVDTTTNSWLNDMRKHIVDLSKTEMRVDGELANKFLDIRVQPGGEAAASVLIQYGRDNGIPVTIKAFGK